MPVPSPDKCLALLACRRPGEAEPGDKATREAVRRAMADPGLKENVARQETLDRGIAALVHELPLPVGFDERVSARYESARRQRTSGRDLLRQPALWAVLLAVAFLLAWGAEVLYERSRGFAGDDAVGRLLESINTSRGSQRLEPLSTECANIGDTLFLKYGLEDFEVPAQFAQYSTVGYRIFENNSFPVAQVMVREHGLTFLMFRADQQGVNILPPGRWKFLTGENWAAAARVSDNICFVAACRGDKEQLRAYMKQADTERKQTTKQKAKQAVASPAGGPQAQNSL